jgi:hypothetical protein
MKTRIFAFAALLVITPAAFCQAHSQEQGPPQPGTKTTPPAVSANFGKLPLSFEANQGQADPAVKFLSHGNGYSLLLTDSAAVLELSKPDPATQTRTMKAMGMNPSTLARARRPVALKTDVVRMELPGAQQNAPVGGTEQLPGKSNYFVGKDPAKWHTNVPTYAKVRYSGVYPGVDLVYYGNQRQLEYDFVIAPGASTKPVKLHFAGASQLKLDSNGDLAVIAKNGEIAFHKPVVYQEKDGQRQPVDGRFTLLAGKTVGFQLGEYDHSRELVIDPVLAYSTYLSGSFSDYIVAIAADGESNVYAASVAGSTDFPFTTGAYRTKGVGTGRLATSVIAVTKFNPAGSGLVYSTFFGGSGTNNGTTVRGDNISSIAVDSSGAAYLTGYAASLDFPLTPGAFDTDNPGGGPDGSDYVYVAKLSPSGSALDYSTLLGDGNNTAVAVDAGGHAYVTGTGLSTSFPVTPGAFDTTATVGGSFITKLNPTGSGLVYSTFLPGASTTALAIDSSASVYVTGLAGIAYGVNANGLPTTPGAFQATNNNISGYGAPFVAKFNPAGSELSYATYISGNPEIDSVNGIAVDGQGYAYITGSTNSTNFPITHGAYDTVDGGTFVTKVNLDGTKLVYSTYLGGKGMVGTTAPGGSPLYGTFAAQGIAVDSVGHAFITGNTTDPTYPTTPGAIQTVNMDPEGFGGVAFLAELDSAGSSLLYSTFLGGTGLPGIGFEDSTLGDESLGVAIDPLGNVYIGGLTFSHDFPVTGNAFQQKDPTLTSAGFLAKFVFNGITTTTVTTAGTPEPAGSKVTSTAYVIAEDGSIPYGELQFTVDGAYVGASLLDETGHAEYSTTSLTTGTHTIEATYLGTSALAASSGVVTETITGQVATPDVVPVGGTYPTTQQVTITDTTSNAVIHYTTDGTMPTAASPIYSAPITVSSTITVKTIAVSGSNAPSASATAAYTITPSAKSTKSSLTVSPTTPTLGEPILLKATVTTLDGTTAAGTVTFLHGNVPIGTATLSGGVASFTAALQETGTHSITANYSGSATERASQSPAVVVDVNP